MTETIGQRIKAARTALQLSQAALGKLVNVDQSTVALWETDKTLPRQDKITDLAVLLHLSPEFLHYGMSDKGGGPLLQTVPVVGYVGEGAELREFPGSHQETLRPPVVDQHQPPASAAVIVRGNAMWPVYRDGDTIYYAESTKRRPALLVGVECVVKLKDGAMMVKRLLAGSRKDVFTLGSYTSPEIRDVAVEWAAPIVWIRRHLPQQAE